MTAARIAAALRRIGAREVTVRINSPGGDMFEGIAIYNLLRGHPAKVTVEVPGWAASAAAIIAMAGDEIRMGMGAFMMVHNAWGAVIGNRHDMREAAGLFDRFDAALADIYEARTGLDRARVVELMDAETFLTASEAVETGFADAADADAPEPAATDEARRGVQAKRRLDALLARQGMPRSERRRLMREATDCGTHDAAASATHDAGIDPAALRRLIDTIRS
ncbi:head maturation protease, ClpP-related [Microbaculum marinum]|uniref:ATP-dependent Clp protease proteolytic subunit n=1 Tax=Microbaculum marinum TaxID=1764581 RepID=A0AAW9RPF9_9HYPH